MNAVPFPLGLALGLLLSSTSFAGPRPLDLEAASAEVSAAYGNAHPEVQEFVLHTARSFGPGGLWLNENWRRHRALALSG